MLTVQERKTKKLKKLELEKYFMDDLEKVLMADQAARTAPNFKIPDYGDQYVAVPHSLLRSAVFKPIQSKDRLLLNKAYIWSQAGYDIAYTGEQLNLEDLRVWETILHMTKAKNFGFRFRLSAYAILKEMNKTLSKSTYDTLSENMIRLTNHRIRISNDSKDIQYIGGLISGMSIEDRIVTFSFTLDADMYRLWNIGDWTKIDRYFLQNLNRKPFTEKLYHFLVSHKTINELPYGYYQELTSNEEIPSPKFKQKLKIGLTELLENQFLESFELGKKTVIIRK